MATLSRAVASPFSYVVSPVDVISIGTFSGVLISPLTKPMLARRAEINKTGFRIAAPNVPQQSLPAKPKAVCTEANAAASCQNCVRDHGIANRRQFWQLAAA